MPLSIELEFRESIPASDWEKAAVKAITSSKKVFCTSLLMVRVPFVK